MFSICITNQDPEINLSLKVSEDILNSMKIDSKSRDLGVFSDIFLILLLI